MLNVMKHGNFLDSQMENFLSTGNLRSSTGLGLMQNTGLTIVAENINRMRYMSHFRAIHRGSFFQEMRTTEARQLLPDAWGNYFIIEKFLFLLNSIEKDTIINYYYRFHLSCAYT